MYSLMNTILDKEQYILIYNASYISLLSSIYAIYRQHYNLALVPGSVFISSILYWKNPDYSYRRYLDMIVVKTALVYQHYMAYNAEYARMYYTILLFTILSYPVGIYYYHKKDYWKSTYAHILVHLIGNVGNVVLYSGYIKQSSNQQFLKE